MIVGLSGYARSGKDTVAGLLIDYERRAFADVLRQALYVLNPYLGNGLTVADVVDEYGWEVAKSGDEVRRLLQVLGTEVGRKMIDNDIWVTMATKDLNPGDKIVFADVRFPNEAQAIKDLGGQVWRIERPGITAVNAHASETAMNGWSFDAIITNDGTLEDLQGQVETALLITRFRTSA